MTEHERSLERIADRALVRRNARVQALRIQEIHARISGRKVVGPTIWRLVCDLMTDRKWRTATDIGLKVKRPRLSVVNSIQYHRDLFEVKRGRGSAVWRLK